MYLNTYALSRQLRKRRERLHKKKKVGGSGQGNTHKDLWFLFIQSREIREKVMLEYSNCLKIWKIYYYLVIIFHIPCFHPMKDKHDFIAEHN